MKTASAKSGCSSFRLWITVVFLILSLIYAGVATASWYFVIPSLGKCRTKRAEICWIELDSYIGKLKQMSSTSDSKLSD